MGTKERFLKAVDGSRFPGIVLDAQGEALCATDGVLLVSAKRSFDEMLAALEKAKVDETMGTPTKQQVSAVVRSALRTPRDLRTALIIDKDTKPSAALSSVMEERRAERATTLNEKIVAIEKRIEALVAAKRTDGSIGTERENLAHEKRMLKENNEANTPMDHGLCVGDAAFDLRVVRKALKAMGSSTGVIYAAGEYDAAILDAGNCTGLVMPFRKG